MKVKFYYRGPFNLRTAYGWRSLFQFGCINGLYRCGLFGWHIDRGYFNITRRSQETP